MNALRTETCTLDLCLQMKISTSDKFIEFHSVKTIRCLFHRRVFSINEQNGDISPADSLHPDTDS